MFNTFDWMPPKQAGLREQAVLRNRVREYFAQQQVMEVITPVMSVATTPDLHIDSIQANIHQYAGAKAQALYLHTSPEFAMKRLLAAGSGDIYQLCPVFRDCDFSPVHNVEFTMLEWYRLAYDHHQLMDDVEALLRHSVPVVQAYRHIRISYQALFQQYTQLNPLSASATDWQQWCDQHGLSYPDTMSSDVDAWLDLVLSFYIQAALPTEQITYIYDYPASQAALSRIRVETPAVASRFEVYWGDLELANGFHELNDADEQRQRFMQDNRRRVQMGKAPVTIDEALLQALETGLPDCAGVALGISRLYRRVASLN